MTFREKNIGLVIRDPEEELRKDIKEAVSKGKLIIIKGPKHSLKFDEEDMLSFGTYIGSQILAGKLDMTTAPTPKEFFERWLQKKGGNG